MQPIISLHIAARLLCEKLGEALRRCHHKEPTWQQRHKDAVNRSHRAARHGDRRWSSFASVSASAHVSVGIGFVAAPDYAAAPVYVSPPRPSTTRLHRRIYYAPPPPPAVGYQTAPAPVV